MAEEPGFYWSASAGWVDYDGLYTPPMACMPDTVTASADGVSGSVPVAVNDPSPTTSARIGNTWLREWWEESLGSPDTRQERIDQAAGDVDLELAESTPGNGFTIDPTSAFTIPLQDRENILLTTIEDDPAAVEYEWEEDGVFYESSEDTKTTLTYAETLDSSTGVWTYEEHFTSEYVITTTADGEAFSSVSGCYHYDFVAAGDASGQQRIHVHPHRQRPGREPHR